MAHPKMALNEKALETQTAAPAQTQPRTGLQFERRFTDGRTSPYDKIEWERRTAQITNEKGQVIFRQENIEVPKAWS